MKTYQQIHDEVLANYRRSTADIAESSGIHPLLRPFLVFEQLQPVKRIRDTALQLTKIDDFAQVLIKVPHLSTSFCSVCSSLSRCYSELMALISCGTLADAGIVKRGTLELVDAAPRTEERLVEYMIERLVHSCMLPVNDLFAPPEATPPVGLLIGLSELADDPRLTVHEPGVYWRLDDVHMHYEEDDYDTEATMTGLFIDLLATGEPDVYPVLAMPDSDLSPDCTRSECGSYIHPHVSKEGEVCMGDHLKDYEMYKSKNDWYGVVDTVTMALSRYNNDSPYSHLWEFSGDDPPPSNSDQHLCPNCGREEHEENGIVWSEYLGDYGCMQCLVECTDDEWYPEHATVWSDAYDRFIYEVDASYVETRQDWYPNHDITYANTSDNMAEAVHVDDVDECEITGRMWYSPDLINSRSPELTVVEAVDTYDIHPEYLDMYFDDDEIAEWRKETEDAEC